MNVFSINLLLNFGRCQSAIESKTEINSMKTTLNPRPCNCLNDGKCRIDGSCQYLNPSTSTVNSCPLGICVQGTCVQTPNGGAYYCICNLGWIGPRCNIRNYCQSILTLCRNGGTCINQLNGYSCSCPKDRYGLSCEYGKI